MPDVEAPLISNVQQHLNPDPMTCGQKTAQYLQIFGISILLGFFIGYALVGSWIIPLVMILIIILLIIIAGSYRESILIKAKSCCFKIFDLNKDGKISCADCQFLWANIASYGGTIVLGFILGILLVYFMPL